MIILINIEFFHLKLSLDKFTQRTIGTVVDTAKCTVNGFARLEGYQKLHGICTRFKVFRIFAKCLKGRNQDITKAVGFKEGFQNSFLVP